jgi:SAM-dependent methyltransferase
MMVRDAHYRAKLPHRARGIADLDRHVGGIDAEIAARLAEGGRVRILELGCGYGTALLELRARYGNRVELCGLNRVPGDGDAQTLLRSARERRIFGDADVDAGDLPTIAYGDAAAGLPFPNDYFDLVVSQVAWLYFGRKIAVIRDVIRVLRTDGLAKIDADEVRPGLPPEYARLVEIWEDGALLPFGAYLSRHAMALAPAPEGHYLRFGKVPSFGEDLEPVFELDLATLHAHWDGIKCVYRIAPPKSPRPSAPPARDDRGT